MPNRIRILSEQLANKIAAGEVVERPASVVKELLENALDAQSTRLTVEIKAGGKQLIRVADNGIGMTRDDTIMAFDRHATSKIGTAEDLNRIMTLGFRGEAIPSIASVSRMELASKADDSLAGTLVQVEGGVIRKVTEVGRPTGTTVTVQQLFYNIPARRKFLKGTDTEARHVANVVTEQALAYPGVAFAYTHNQRELINLPATTELSTRIRDLFGSGFLDDMLPVAYQASGITVSGYIGKPNAARATRSVHYLLVNQRCITNRLANHAIYQAYGTMLPKDRHPLVMLFLTLAPSAVDVNVHPTKREVRFSNDALIHETVSKAVRQALRTAAIIPSLDQKRAVTTVSESTGPVPPDPTQTPAKRSPDLSSSPDSEAAPAIQPPLFSPSSTPASKPMRSGRSLWDKSPPPVVAGNPPSPTGLALAATDSDQNLEQDPKHHYGLVPLWQLHNTYILAQIKNGLVIIDQHVAHERVLYDQALKSLQESTGSAQQILFPITMELSPAGFSILEQNLQLFTNLGFGLKLFSNRTVVIEAVPAMPWKRNPETLLRDMIDELLTRPSRNTSPEEKLAAAFACRASIKAGDSLTQLEMNALINALFATSMPYTCPHGRPIVVRMSLDELERRFKRI